MSLTFVGLGLEKKGISLRGLEEIKKATTIYAELYTSIVYDLSPAGLEELIGKPVKIVSRNVVEEAPDEILRRAKSERVVILVPGDPMVATTHVDLRLRAHRADIPTEVIHAGSILSATAGLLGLQSYKFGPSATIPFSDNPSSRPYDILMENKSRGLHTLLLLDFRVEENRAMSAQEAIETMLRLEKKHANGVFTLETLVAVIARGGTQNSAVKADRVGALFDVDFGPPPHSLVVPGKLHFMEAEALHAFAGAPESAVNELVE